MSNAIVMVLSMFGGAIAVLSVVCDCAHQRINKLEREIKELKGLDKTDKA